MISISDFFLASRSLATNLLRARSSSVFRLRAGGVPSNTKIGRMLCFFMSIILERIDFIFSLLSEKMVSIFTIQIEASIATILPASC